MIPGLEERGKILIVRKPFPLIGHIGFGIIDRGYNNLQVRVTSLCNLNCIFCSVDAGPKSKRIREFLVMDPQWVVENVAEAIRWKGRLHVLLDAAGDPLTNPLICEYVKKLKRLPGVETVSLETRLHGANENLINCLAEAGLDRINLSVDTLDPKKAKALAGTPSYDIKKVVSLAEYIANNTNIDIHITPVWIPGVNDLDIENIIRWALRAGFGKRVPPLGIQKYVVHKHGRKIRGVKEWSWSMFYSKLKELEKKHGIKLVLSPEDYKMHPAPRIPCQYTVGQYVKLSVVCKGWLRNEYLALPPSRNRVFTLISKRETFETGDVVVSRIIRDKDGILIAVPA